jgi:hypothetical protein
MVGSPTVVTAFRRLSSSMPCGSTCVSRSATETSRISSPSAASTSATRPSGAGRDRPELGVEVRTSDRAAVNAAPTSPEQIDGIWMVVRIAGKRMYLWRAVDHEGEVLDLLVQSRRDSRAALRLMRKLLRKQGFVPKLLVTDKLRSYGSAFRKLKVTCPHEQGAPEE